MLPRLLSLWLPLAACVAFAAQPLSAAAAPADPVALVNPFIGTSGTKIGGPIDTFPGADAPFGMVQWSPDTPSQPAGGGYDYGDKAITGFSIDHLSGPGCSVFGDLRILPVVGTPADPMDAQQSYSHADEQASPGYYAVALGSPAIQTQLTVTRRSGLGRFTFPSSQNAELLFDAASNQAGVDDASIRIVSPTQIEGSATTGNFCGMPDVYTVYFAVQFDRPMLGYGMWHGKTVTANERSAQGPNVGAFVRFDTTVSRSVGVRVALSWVDPAGALGNLRAARDAWDLDAVKAETAQRWRTYLSRIAVTGGTPTEQTIFYTALYHALLHPNLYSDADGRYRGFDDAIHRVRPGHSEYANFSGWDIYRTLTPLLALVAPHRTSDMMQSLVDAAHQGGWLPKWPLVNGYSSVMGGDPADPILAAAYAFGARDFDAHHALEAMLKNARDNTSPAGQGWYRPRPGIEEYDSRGYVVNSHTTNVSPVPNGASLTLEYAVDDFSIAQFAQSLHDLPIYRRFMTRSQRWSNLFDTAAGWVAPRDRSGAFMQTPITANGQSGFQEGNTTQYTWMVPQDLAGLIAGIGGKARAAAQLDEVFRQLNAGQDKPYIWLGNEPSLGAPWTYLSVGEPWKAQQVIREAVSSLYTDAPDGIPGNDDLGTMSAWYVWCALGLYPSNPAIAGFDLGTPLFTSATIRSPGRTITISAPAAGDTDPYIESVQIDGRTATRAWTALPPHGPLTITVDAGPKPSRWGTGPKDAPPSYPAGPVRFPPSTTALFADANPHVRIAGGSRAALRFAFKDANAADRSAIHWRAQAASGIDVTPSSGIAVPNGAPVSLTVSAQRNLPPHVYALTVFANGSNGAQLAPLHVAVTAAARGAALPLAYAPDYSDNAVTSFDPVTGAIASTIAVGQNPGDAALAPDGRRVYVPNQGSNTVSVIDTARQDVMATIAVGKTPASIRVTRDGRTAWVTNNADNTVQPIDLANDVAGKPIAVGRSPQQLAVSSDGATIYVVDQADNAVSVVDAKTGTQERQIAVGPKPLGIVLSPNGRFAYVSDQGANQVSILDLSQGAAVASVPAGVQPSGMTLANNGRTLYVADSGSDTVSVLDVRRRVVTAQLRVALNPSAVALSPDGKMLFVVAYGDNDCVKVPIGGGVRTIIPLGDVPIGLALP